MGAKGTSVNQQTLTSVYMILRQTTEIVHENADKYRACNNNVQNKVDGYDIDVASKENIMEQTKANMNIVDSIDTILSQINQFVDNLLETANDAQKRANTSAASATDRTVAAGRSLRKH